MKSQLAASADIRWHEAEVGRLLQVRCFLGQQQIDVIGFYQYALLQKAGSDSIFQQRRRLLNKLDSLLAAMPARSHILLAGDFNATLVRESKIAGYGILDRDQTEKERDDQQRLMQILRRHKLTSLNTWGKKTRAATYLHARGQSQIDYVCVRQAISDGVSKCTGPQRTPMAGWRTTGHLPIVGSIPLRWTPWKQKKGTHQKHPCSDIAKLRSLADATGTPSVIQLREAVTLAGGEAPDKPVRPVLTSVDDKVRHLWRMRRRLSVLQTMLGGGIMFIFKFFRLRLQCNKAHRALKKSLRARKRQRTLELLQQAEHAAIRNDVRELFGVVRLLCPKQHTQRIRLRDGEGHLMNGVEECQALAKYAQELFMAPATPPFELLPIPEDMLSLGCWRRAMRKLKPEKAAPNNTPPLRNWKQHDEDIIVQVRRIAVSKLCQARPTIPAEWTEVQIAWLAKPKKCPSNPANLRTVGLMAGDTKLLMMVLQEAIQEHIMWGVWDVPQFAYRKMTSTIDALLRGSLHCQKIRTAAGMVNTNVTTKLTTGAIPRLIGGVMISLDLAKAFDCVPFAEMYVGLREVNVPDNLARLIVEVHRQSTCIVRHGGHEVRVKMHRGLRQGCPLAPSIYTAWTVRLCRSLGPEWCREHTSLFADDVHGYWEVHSMEQFQEARHSILRVVAALHRSGMRVNFSKSVVVLLLRGQDAANLKQRYVKWRGNRYVLEVGIDCVTGLMVRLPIEDRMEYLGAVLSYGPMETQTASARIAKAWANFTQLRPMLRTNSTFSTARRLRIFKACVIPAMLYGLIGVGFSASSLRALTSTVARMLRKVLRLYEHGISNLEVIGRADVNIHSQLQQMIAAKAHNLDCSDHQSSELRATAQQRLGDIAAELQRISEVQDSQLIEVDRSGDAVSCPICGLEFGNHKSLEAHYTSKHAVVHIQARTQFDRREHSLFGLPQCRLCRQTLFDWVSLERHFTEGRCPRLKSAAAQNIPFSTMMDQVRAEETLAPPKPPVSCKSAVPTPCPIPSVLIKCHLKHLPAHAEEIFKYKTQCILCGQQVKSSAVIKNHWRSTHPEAWAMVQQDTESASRSLRSTFSRPCQFCGSTAKHGTTDSTHHATKCSPLFQVLAARHLAGKGQLERHMHDKRGPSLKQGEKTPQYMTVAKSSIQAILSGGLRGQKTPEAGIVDAPITVYNTVEQTHHTLEEAAIESCSPDDGTGVGHTDTVMSCRLTNPHSLCYLNASILAMIHAYGEFPKPRGLEQIIRII